MATTLGVMSRRAPRWPRPNGYATRIAPGPSCLPWLLEVFAEDGYSGARVDEIAERTRTTKRMIYYYFGGKEQLYLAVLEQAYTTIREAENNLPVDDLAPVDALRKLAELTYDHHREHPDFIRLVSIENIHRGEFVRRIDSLRTLSAPTVSRLDALLARGRAAGQFRSDVDAVDVHLVISAYCVFQVANQHTFQLPVRPRLGRAGEPRPSPRHDR